MPSETSFPIHDTLAEALIVCDDQDRIIEATRSACDLMGYSREDLLSRSLRDLAGSPEAAEASRLLEKLQEEATIAFESGVRVKDGSTQAFHLRLSRWSVEGRRHSVVRVARRRRASDKLPDDRDFIRALLETSASLLMVVDARGRIVFFNKACERATGYSFADLRGRSLWELVSETDEARQLQAAFEDVRLSRFPARLRQEWRTKNGRTTRVDWASTLLFHPDGSVRHVIGTGLAADGRPRPEAAAVTGSERGLVEEALLEREGWLRSFAEQSEDLVYRYRIVPEPAFEYVSPAVLRMTGYTAQEHYRDPALSLKVVHPHDRFLVEEIVKTGRVPEKPFKLRWIRKDGRQIWMEQRIEAVWDATGRIVAIDGIARDISERRRTERCREALYLVTRVLAESATFADAAPRLLQILHQCHDWKVGTIWLLDTTSNVLRLAEVWHPPDVPVPEFERLCRSLTFRPGEEFPGRIWSEGKAVWIRDVLRQPDLVRGAAAAREGLGMALGFPITLGGQVLGVFEFFSDDILPPDGETPSILESIGSQVGQFIGHRRVEQRQATQYGVTRILAEASTFDAAAPRILEAVCESLGWEVGAVWLVDQEADLLRLDVLWSGTPEQALGSRAASPRRALRRGADLAGRVWDAGKPLWIHDLATHPEFELSDLDAGKGPHGAFGFPILLGAEVLGVLEFLSSEIRQPDGETLAMIGAIGSQIGQFIERKAVEAEVFRLNESLERRVAERTAQLGEAVREMSTFTYSIAHDLRAPLRAMSGFCQAMVEDFSFTMDPTCLDYARRVASSARKMDALIRDLLTYGSLIHLEIEPEPVPLDAVIRTVMDEMAPELSRRGALVDLSRPLGAVRGNPSMLVQVVANLLSNAIKFVAPGTRPRVTLRTEARNGRLRLWVEDNGIGIAPEFHGRIFGIFERLNREEEYPGTGIGLAIVRKALDRIGGKAGVESAAGQGSRFWIELPAAEPPAPA